MMWIYPALSAGPTSLNCLFNLLVTDLYTVVNATARFVRLARVVWAVEWAAA